MSQIIFVSKNTPIHDAFSTLTEALDSLTKDSSERVEIRIYPGIYREKVTISHSNLHLIGMGDRASDVVISNSDYAFDSMPDGSRRGTFRSYTMLVDAGDVSISNLTIENTSKDENADGQAIALYADGDRLLFENIRLIGRQDTLFTGPLPPKELQPGGFIGPKQFAPRINGHHLYRNCYICGNVDFIFGSASAVFELCVIESLARSAASSSKIGYVCAPSTPEGQKTGYVFKNCRFISRECAPSTCFLARPWRSFAKAVFLSCEIGPHICPEGFHDWNKPEAHSTILFAAHDCSCDRGAFVPTADFATSLDEEEVRFYTSREL